MMQNKDNNYKRILKVTSLFSGAQFIQMVVMIVRSKVVAVLLGPSGIGLIGLLTSITNLIDSIASMGLTQTAVSNLSQAYDNGDETVFDRAVAVFKRLTIILGVIGLLLTLLLSPLWSWLTFGNYSYTLAISALSCVLLMNQATKGFNVLMQSTKNLKFLATAGIYGSIIGLLVTLPLYFIYKQDGIVPAMIVTSAISLLVSYTLSRNINCKKVTISNRQAFHEGSHMLRLGFAVMLQSVMFMLVAYIIRIYIGHEGGLEYVGLYTSGFAILDAATSIVFTSLSAEYYPRLSITTQSTATFNNVINQQMHLSIMILGPMLAAFELFGELALQVLYSSRFTGAAIMMQLAMFGVLLKGPAFCLGYAFLAKNDLKAYLPNETLSLLTELILSIVGYKYFGLNGIGLAFLISFLIYLLQTLVICRFRYHYVFDIKLLRALLPQLLIAVIIFALTFQANNVLKWTVGILLLLLSLIHVAIELRTKLEKQ